MLQSLKDIRMNVKTPFTNSFERWCKANGINKKKDVNQLLDEMIKRMEFAIDVDSAGKSDEYIEWSKGVIRDTKKQRPTN